MEDMELVTVVVPALDEQDTIGSCLASILRQDYPALEVLVVDGGSRDATGEVVRAIGDGDPRVRLLHNPRRRIPVSLNLALSHARGPWLVRVDAHSTVPTNYVGTMVAHLRTGAWGGVGARKDAVGEDRVDNAIAAALGSQFGVGNSAYHYATKRREVDHVPFGAYPTALLRSLGGWNEELEANEDYEMDHRIRSAGHRLLLDPSVAIRWRARPTLGGLFRQYRRYGRGKAEVAWMHPGSIKLRHLAAPALVAALGGAAVLSARRPAIGLAVAAPYAAALTGASVVAARRHGDLSAAPLVAASFVAMHTAWGIGMYEGLARRVSATVRRVSAGRDARSSRGARTRPPSGPADTTETSSRRAS